MKPSYGLILVLLTPLFTSCDQLGLENPAAEQARIEAEGKAIGSGCRQTGRALEDCYEINRRASKAAIFAGWRDMDAYMRENKIEEIKPESAANPPAAAGRAPQPAGETGQSGEQTPAQKPATASAKPAAEAVSAETAPIRKKRPALAR